MAGLFVLLVYLAGGFWIARVIFFDKTPLVRSWLGLSLGMLAALWLPVLFAFFVRFTMLAQGLALGSWALISLITGVACNKHAYSLAAATDSDRRLLIAALCFVVPLTLFSAYLQYTHTLRPVEGALHVGQATYGDLPMHLSIITGLNGATIPGDYIILPGSPMGYPFVTDALSTTLMQFGMPLAWSMIVPGTVMSALVYLGFLILAYEMTGSVLAAVLAGVLLFFNGGLGFLYTFDMAGNTFEKLKAVFTGFYQTPANDPTYNLRFSNLVVDLFLPQRTFLGGWTLLLPALYLAGDGFTRLSKRSFVFAALFAGALPLVHAHSLVALALYSSVLLLYGFCTNASKKTLLVGAGMYLGMTALLALPQVVFVTMKQVTAPGFVSLITGWVNHANGVPVDWAPWFWAKNIGLPLLAIVAGMIDFRKNDRADILGASLIFAVANFIQFQPLDYDNNKLIYIAYLLLTPMAASWCVRVYRALQGSRARVLLAVLFIAGSVCSGVLSMGREAVSDYQLFSAGDVAVAEFVKAETPRDARFLTGQEHQNPVYALAGREVWIGPPLYLHWHGLPYQARAAQAQAFLKNPAGNLALLQEAEVSYLFVGPYERHEYGADPNVLSELFEVVYDDGGYWVFKVGT